MSGSPPFISHWEPSRAVVSTIAAVHSELVGSFRLSGSMFDLLLLLGSNFNRDLSAHQLR
jgi:hypothetical protein